MNEAQRAKVVLKILNQTYPKTPIPLRHKNIFTLLISVLLSAQCTDINVNKVTKKIYPKQQIVIYNFDQSGGTMAVKIQGKTIANINARSFLRLYVTKSLRVIAERQQLCDFIW